MCARNQGLFWWAVKPKRVSARHPTMTWLKRNFSFSLINVILTLAVMSKSEKKSVSWVRQNKTRIIDGLDELVARVTIQPIHVLHHVLPTSLDPNVSPSPFDIPIDYHRWEPSGLQTRSEWDPEYGCYKICVGHSYWVKPLNYTTNDTENDETLGLAVELMEILLKAMGDNIFDAGSYSDFQAYIRSMWKVCCCVTIDNVVHPTAETLDRIKAVSEAWRGIAEKCGRQVVSSKNRTIRLDRSPEGATFRAIQAPVLYAVSPNVTRFSIALLWIMSSADICSWR